MASCPAIITQNLYKFDFLFILVSLVMILMRLLSLCHVGLFPPVDPVSVCMAAYMSWDMLKQSKILKVIRQTETKKRFTGKQGKMLKWWKGGRLWLLDLISDNNVLLWLCTLFDSRQNVSAIYVVMEEQPCCWWYPDLRFSNLCKLTVVVVLRQDERCNESLYVCLSSQHLSHSPWWIQLQSHICRCFLNRHVVS